MFWGTRATNFSIYTTKMEGAGPKMLGTGAKFKRVPCQKNCRVNRALVVGVFRCRIATAECVKLPRAISRRLASSLLFICSCISGRLMSALIADFKVLIACCTMFKNGL